MSGVSYSSMCPQCNGDKLMAYNDSKPYSIENGECLDCGFVYFTQEDQLSLEEVNELRSEYGLKPRKSLREQTV